MTEANAAAELRSEHMGHVVTTIDFDDPLQELKAEEPEEAHEELKLGTPEFAARCRKLGHRSLGYRFLKRFFDVVFSLCVVVVGLIPSLFLSIAIVIDTKGSPIYSQVRVGKWGEPFRIYKFRTMVADSDNVEKYFTPEQLEVWKRERKVDNDPRITRLGCVLRATSIDETVQFLNVLLDQILLRILKTRPEFSEESMGAFAIPARSSTNKGKVFSQVVNCFASGLRMRRISGPNCNRIGGPEIQFLAKPVFMAVCA